MPPPTEQGFQPSAAPVHVDARMSQCPLQQNKDFNSLDELESFGGEVAMPPPTEQGFQPDGMSSQKEAWLSQCPLQQNKDFN